MSSNNVFKLFVYGSLRSGFHSPAYNYVSKYFKLTGEAKVKGLLYDMGNYPVGVISSDDKYIVGELYDIINKEAFDYAIAQLDDYEGLNGEDGDDVLYERVVTNILVDETTTTQAWVYWYKGNIANKTIVQSGDVLQYFKEKNNL